MLPTKFSLGAVAHILVMVCFMVIELTECASAGRRSQYRPKRTAVISLPASALGVRWTQQVIVPVLAMINQTNTYLWFDFQVYTKMPTANNLTKLYTSLGRSMDNSDGNYIDEDFLEDQIANQERKTIYQYIESFFNNFGLNGPACVKRAICEMAEAPLSGNGLFGQVVELLLTPSLKPMPKEMEPHYGPNRTRREVDPELEVLTLPVEDDYTEAYRRGKTGLCWSHYAACSVNIIKLLTF